MFFLNLKVLLIFLIKQQIWLNESPHICDIVNMSIYLYSVAAHKLMQKNEYFVWILQTRYQKSQICKKNFCIAKLIRDCVPLSFKGTTPKTFFFQNTL